MRPVNLKASRLFEKLISLAEDNNGYYKLDNSSAFMPLTVEILSPNTFSFAHYYVQNSDMMRDPEVVLWRSPGDQRLYPQYHRQDPYHEQTLINFDENGKVSMYLSQSQRGVAVFCGKWAAAIKRQQEI